VANSQIIASKRLSRLNAVRIGDANSPKCVKRRLLERQQKGFSFEESAQDATAFVVSNSLFTYNKCF
jgi:hypothetical protein